MFRISTAPGADRLFKLIAFHSVRATVGQNPGRLVRQVLSGVDNLILQGNLMPDM
jgi:hypothetical protein